MTKKFRLAGLECANCAAKMEKDIGALDGVNSVSVNHMTEKMVIDAEDVKMEAIVASAEQIVKKYEPDVVMKKA